MKNLILLSFLIVFSISCGKDGVKNSSADNVSGSIPMNFNKPVQSLNKSEGYQIRYYCHPATQKDITEIKVTISKVQVVSNTGNVITVSDEKRIINLIDFAKDNPLELINKVIPSGRYKQIRLILDHDHHHRHRCSRECTDDFVQHQNNTITINGKTYPLKTPRMIILKGAFEITSGLFYSMTVNFDPNKSIIRIGHYGYLLKPVMKIESNTLISGPFSISGLIGDITVVTKLNTDGTFQAKTSVDPRIEINGDYYYNYSTSILSFETMEVSCLTCSGIPSLQKDNFTGLEIANIKINSYDNTNILGTVTSTAADGTISSNDVKFTKKDNYYLDTSTGYTNLQVVVKYTNTSYNGQIGILVMMPLDSKTFTDFQKITNNTATFYFKIKNNYLSDGFFSAGQKSFRGRMYITTNISDLKIDVGTSLVCGVKKVSDTDYFINVPVSTEILQVSVPFNN